MNKFKYILSIPFLALTGYSNAQTVEAQPGFFEQYQLEIILTLVALVAFLTVLALFVALFALRTFIALDKPKSKQTVTSEGFWKNFFAKINEAVPIEKEDTVMTSHEYDGIRELDNQLPPWWLYGFYFTILFAVVYLLNFHVFKSGDLQTAEYEKEMADAKEQVEVYLASLDNRIDENSVSFTDDEQDLLAGQEIYNINCLVCHGANGEGVVGPNFTDKYWIHGGDIPSIFKTIKYGVPEKGMISWQAQLTPKQIQQVSSFIYTLEGTNPPNPKEPQGEIFERATE